MFDLFELLFWSVQFLKYNFFGLPNLLSHFNLIIRQKGAQATRELRYQNQLQNREHGEPTGP